MTGGGVVWQENGDMICDLIGSRATMRPPDEIEANVEFIVRACNSYEVMLEALEEAHGMLLERSHKFNEEEYDKLERIEAAIAKAKGGE